MPTDFVAAVRHLRRADAILSAHIRRIGPCVLPAPTRFSTFDALLTTVTHQQLHGAAAKRIEARVRERLPTPEAFARARLPTLRSLGLSENKALTLSALAKAHVKGTLPTGPSLRRLSDDEVVEQLTAYRGIGPWTVHMLLMFRLSRPDVLPTGDFGVRAGFTKLYGLRTMVTPKVLAMHAEAWRPYRSVASWYLWRVHDVA